jgi:hypothetical protein
MGPFGHSIPVSGIVLAGEEFMPLSAEHRRQVLEAIVAGRLRLEAPQKMYAGYGEGRECAGCGDVIDKTQVEWEAIYQDGQAYRLHLGCAGLWEAERRRRQQSESGSDDARQLGARWRRSREQAQEAQDGTHLRDRADVLAREADAVIEEARKVRGEPRDTE